MAKQQGFLKIPAAFFLGRGVPASAKTLSLHLGTQRPCRLKTKWRHKTFYVYKVKGPGQGEKSQGRRRLIFKHVKRLTKPHNPVDVKRFTTPLKLIDKSYKILPYCPAHNVLRYMDSSSSGDTGLFSVAAAARTCDKSVWAASASILILRWARACLMAAEPE